jgi:hypothetical protein
MKQKQFCEYNLKENEWFELIITFYAVDTNLKLIELLIKNDFSYLMRGKSIHLT